MTRTVNRLAVSGAAVCCVLGLAMPAIGQAAGDIRIYGGDSLKENGIVLKPWGSGEVKESEEQVLTGSRALKVTTQGLHQGAHIVLQKPIDIGPAISVAKNYLRISLKVADTSSTSGMSGYGGPGMMGGPGMPGMGGKTGGNTAPGMGGMPGMGPGGTNTTTKTTKPKAIDHVRIVLVTADGKKSEVVLDLDDAPRGRDDWRTLAVPLQKIVGLAQSDGKLTDVMIFGDSTGVLYVGEIGTVHDDTPITVGDLSDRTVAVNDNVTFTAEGEGGNSSLLYQWTVVPKDQAPTNMSDLPVDMEGRSVKYEFRKSGDYVVIVTVRDLYGLKTPVSRSTNIHVSL